MLGTVQECITVKPGTAGDMEGLKCVIIKVDGHPMQEEESLGALNTWGQGGWQESVEGRRAAGPNNGKHNDSSPLVT
jgi:hypothetical protein